MGKMTSEQKNRFAIAEKVITRDALASGLTLEDLISVADYVERGAVWRKPAKKKRRRGRPGATGHLNTRDGRAYWAPAGEPLPNPYEPWKPLGLLTEDGLKEDPSFSAADAFRKKAQAETAPQPLTLSALDLDRAVRDLREKARRGDLAAGPAPVKAADGIDLRGIRTRWDAERNVQRGVYPAMPGVRHEDADVSQLDEGNAAGCEDCAAELERRGLTDLDRVDPEETKLLEPSPVPGLSPAAWEAALKNAAKAGRSREETEKHLNKCSLCRELAEADARGELFTVEEAAAITDTPLLEVRKNLDSTEAGESFSPVGEDPGDRGILTQWAEAIRQQDAAREAAREARDLEVDPEEKRNESLERGRGKLRDRLTTMEQRNTDRVEPLDEDELLAVAGRELYSPGDPEPGRTEKIRNRKGEVLAHDRDGWTAMPGNPWALHYAWTSLEMSRRGPWHVI